MIICRVVGHVWATKKEQRLEGLKFMVVKEEYGRDARLHVAADAVGAGIGEQVLVVSGSTARGVFGGDVPTDMTIVGIIDSLEVERAQTQQKAGRRA